MKGKTKKSIIVLIVLLAIGFAAVTTTLTINGVIHLGANEDNFKENLIFTRAALTYSDSTKTALEVGGDTNLPNVDNLKIEDSGKKISFTTETLKNIGESVVLTYDVTNNSQYGAEFKGIECTVTNKAGDNVTEAVVTNKTGEYIKLEADTVTETIASKDKTGNKLENKKLTVTMIKSYVGAAGETAENATTSYNVECEISASGLSE